MEIFSCIIVNKVSTVEKTVVDHVDVSSWGMSIRGGYSPDL